MTGMLAAALLVALVVMMTLGGCAMVQDVGSHATQGSSGPGATDRSSQATPFPWEEGVELTEDLGRVAGTLGFDEDDIERMRAEGVDEASWRRLAPALAAEEHIAQKYGIGFTAIDCSFNLTDDQAGRRACMVRVTPQEGANAGSEYLVRCDWTEDPAAPVWTEDYLAAARADEYAAYVEGLLEPDLGGLERQVVVSASLYGGDMYGDDEGPNTPIEDLARTHMGELFVYVRRSEGMDEAAFDEFAASVMDAARGTGLRLYVTVGCIDRLEENGELTPEVGAGAMRNRDATEAERMLPVCTWRRAGAVNGSGAPQEPGAQASS